MTRKDFCKMCTEYSANEKCESIDSCEFQAKLQKIFEGIEKLREENKELRKKVEKMEAEKSWRDFPDMMGK